MFSRAEHEKRFITLEDRISLKMFHFCHVTQLKTRIDVYETLCPTQMLVHKGGKIKNWGGECRDVTPTNCSLKIYLKRALGGGGSGWRGQDGCE